MAAFRVGTWLLKGPPLKFRTFVYQTQYGQYIVLKNSAVLMETESQKAVMSERLQLSQVVSRIEGSSILRIDYPIKTHKQETIEMILFGKWLGRRRGSTEWIFVGEDRHNSEFPILASAPTPTLRPMVHILDLEFERFLLAMMVQESDEEQEIEPKGGPVPPDSKTLGNCSICRADMFREQPLTKCPKCQNETHSSCLLSWFSKCQTCPLCRYNYAST